MNTSKHISIFLAAIFLAAFISLEQVEINTRGNRTTIDTNQSLNTDTSACIVYTSFIVNRKGKIKNVKVDSCLCDSTYSYQKSIEKEAIRVIRNMQDWKPAKLEGKPIKAKFNMPIRFVSSQDTTRNN